MKKNWACAAILFAFALVSASAAGNKKIVFATDATWPPMEFVDDSKNIVGFDIDLIKEAGKQGGFDVEVKNVNWDGIFGGLDAGQYDAVISSVTITDDRKKTMDFSIPYLSAGQVLIVRSDTPATVKGLSDMAGKTVGSQIGTTGALAVEKAKGVKGKTYDEAGLAVEDLTKGRLDGVVVDNSTAINYVLQNPGYKGQLKIVGQPFTDESYGVAVKKGNKAVLDLINAGLRKALATDKKKEFENKWLK